MTYPLAADPLPPGHGEATIERPDADRTYVVLVTLGDGVTNVESRWGRLDKALEERDRVRAELVLQNYRDFHVGVQDEDDPEKGWLDGDE